MKECESITVVENAVDEVSVCKERRGSIDDVVGEIGSVSVNECEVGSAIAIVCKQGDTKVGESRGDASAEVRSGKSNGKSEGRAKDAEVSVEAEGGDCGV